MIRMRRWQPVRQRQAQMYYSNPAYIPRNHLVEEVIDAATSNQNYEPFEQLPNVLARPFDYDAELARFAMPLAEDQVVHQTFCGT